VLGDLEVGEDRSGNNGKLKAQKKIELDPNAVDEV
jgi:hypothetical protein